MFGLATLLGNAQTVVSVHDIQYVSPSDLANCLDDSPYDGQTVTVRGIVMHDGNLTEIASGSVNGGYRAAIHLLDTANNGMGGDFTGLQIHGVFTDAQGASQPVAALNSLLAGDIVEITGNVGTYEGETQLYPSDNNSVTIVGSTTAPEPTLVNVGDLNNGNRENQLPTGEPLEGQFVLLRNVTVTAVNLFSSGSRISIDVTDQNGDVINVSDRFIAQKLPAHSAVNPGNAGTNGSFVAPPVGLVYDSLMGIVIHSRNGCTGGSGRGYELNPFSADHYVVGVTPPSITEVVRTPAVPTTSETVVVDCKVTDFDGSVVSVSLNYTDDIAGGSYTTLPMTLVGGSSDEYTATIPAYAEGSMIGYYIEAEDNEGFTSTYPATASGPQNVQVYHVRDNGLTIEDVQKVLDPTNDASYYTGYEVTVTGVVTASSKDYDLGYVYIQQPGLDAWNGISLIGNSDLVLLLRTEEVTITGTVVESFGLTQIQVSDVQKTGNVIANEVTYFDPSDDALYTSGEIEKYEGMLVGMDNGSTGLFMTNENAGFGDYRVGTSFSAARSTMVLTGRSQSASSLWVSLIADSNFIPTLEVTPVMTTPTMQMDTLIGLMSYGFSNYRVLPRNNDDIRNLSDNGTSIPLDSTDLILPDTGATSVVDVFGSLVETSIYPNPANNEITVVVSGLNESYSIALYDLSGAKMMERTGVTVQNQISVADLTNGLYIMKVTNASGIQLAIQKVIVKH
jgi:hypothetical protein